MAGRERHKAPVSSRSGTGNTSASSQDRGWNPPFGDPDSVPGQIKAEESQGAGANRPPRQALRMPQLGHVHTSSLHPSMTNGSQHSGKQQSSITAKKIHPPVDNPFFCINGIASWPQNGHCGVNERPLKRNLEWYIRCNQANAQSRPCQQKSSGRKTLCVNLNYGLGSAQPFTALGQPFATFVAVAVQFPALGLTIGSEGLPVSPCHLMVIHRAPRGHTASARCSACSPATWPSI